MIRRVVALIPAFVLQAFSQQPASAQERNACFGIDVSKPAAVFACMSTSPNRNQYNSSRECHSVQGSWFMLLETFGMSRIRMGPNEVPSCPVIAEAMKLLNGQPPNWASCLVRGDAGTDAHVRACLESFASNVLPSLNSCTAVFDRYELGLQYATPRVVPARQNDNRNVSSRPGQLPDPLPPPRPRIGASPFDDPAVREDWFGNADYPRLRTRDCQVAARVMTAVSSGRVPEWAACSNYSRDQPVEHVKACLGNTIITAGNCAAGRDLYEAKLKAAYGGNLPPSYQVLGCDVLDPILKAARDAAAQRETASRPAVSTERTPARPDNSFPWGFILIVIAIVLGGAVWKLFPGRGPTGHARRTTALNLDEEQIRRMFEAKQGDISYEGSASTQFLVTAGQKTSFHTLSFAFRLARNIAAMPHREREFLKIFLLMNTRGWIPDALGDRIHFGLVYGDGKAASYAKDFRITEGASQQSGIKNLTDALRWYANDIGGTTDGAVSELMTLFGRMKQQLPDNPLIEEIQNLLAEGNRWLVKKDMPGSAFERKAGRHGLFVGLDAETRSPVAYYGEGSLATIAPPGAGKSQCHIIPNLLMWRGPALVLDVKGELWAATSKWRRENVGPVYRFAPFEPQRSHCYNPLSVIRSNPDFLWEDCTLLAELMVVPRSKSDPFWEESAQRILTAFIAYVCRRAVTPAERSMSRVLDLASGVGWEDFVVNSKLDSDLPSLVRAGTSFEEMESRSRSGVLSQILTSLKAWEGARIMRVTQKSDWSPLDLRSEKNPTIYICVKPEEIEASLSLLRVFIGQHIRTLTRSVPGEAGHDVLFLIDEFPQLRRMPPIEEGISIGRGYRIKLWLVAQSLGQIRNAYPQADALLGQCGLRSFMNASLQDGSAQKVSEDLGFFDSLLDGTRQRLLEPQAVAGPEYRDMQIVFTHGAKPLRLFKLLAYADDGLRKRFGEAAWPPN